jgi:drug/metabolite transporter (DMT)-like permease
LGEIPEGMQLAGGLLMTLGVFILVLARRRPKIMAKFVP